MKLLLIAPLPDVSIRGYASCSSDKLAKQQRHCYVAINCTIRRHCATWIAFTHNTLVSVKRYLATYRWQ